MSERMRMEPRVDPYGVIVIGAVHGDCFHPLGWIGDANTLAMLAFPSLEAFRAFIRELAQISVMLSQQEGLDVADIMAQVDAIFRGHGPGPAGPGE